MFVQIDNREASLFTKCQDMSSLFSGVQLVSSVLTLGDIVFYTSADAAADATVEPLVIIERKSFQDLLASIKDGRYEEQSYRLIGSANIPRHHILYIVEGMFTQLRSPQEKKMVMSAIISLNLFKGFSVYRTASLHETAEWIMSLASKINKEFGKGKRFAHSIPPAVVPSPPSSLSPLLETNDIHNTETIRETPPSDAPLSLSTPTPISVETAETETTGGNNYCHVVKKVKKDNITPENIGEIMLCQIPGISSVLAIEIMKEFGNLPNLLTEVKSNPQRLENIRLTSNGKSRKIAKNVVENIRKYLVCLGE
jgi:ERCC4-type nuclease